VTQICEAFLEAGLDIRGGEWFLRNEPKNSFLFNSQVSDVATDWPETPPVSPILVVRDGGERGVMSANANAVPPLTQNLSFS